jgi:UDP:flavonoid glycosyltransferase YjiC (YdhE family)
MLVLCTATPMDGVVLPFAPIGRALAARGHDIVVAAGPDVAPRIAEMGFEHRVVGPGAMEAAMRAFSDPQVAAGPSGAGPAFGAAMFAGVFAPALLPAVRDIVDELHPDVIVHPAVEVAGPIVAAEHNLPSVTYGFGQLLEPAIESSLTERVAALWREAGLQPDPHAGIYRDLYLDPCPPSLRLAQPPAGATVQPLRPEIAGGHDEDLPAELAGLGTRPVVYVSLGTVPLFNQLSTFELLLGALAGQPLDVVVTVGPNNDPAPLAQRWANVRVTRWLPLGPVLQLADAVICHGGSGTTLAALAAGRPLVLVPQGADQFLTATACARGGVALVLSPGSYDDTDIRDAVNTVLAGNSPQRAAARRLAAEIATMPDAVQAAIAIEALVTNRT